MDGAALIFSSFSTCVHIKCRIFEKKEANLAQSHSEWTSRRTFITEGISHMAIRKIVLLCTGHVSSKKTRRLHDSEAEKI